MLKNTSLVERFWATVFELVVRRPARSTPSNFDTIPLLIVASLAWYLVR